MAEVFDNFENEEEAKYAEEEIKSVKGLADIYRVLTPLNVRNAPDTTGKVLEILAKGQKVSVSETLGDWSKIGEGRYVMTQFLKKES